MSLHTVNNLRDGVAGILSGIDINNVDNLNGAFERGARITVQKADIPEASITQNLTLYAGVYDYPCDTRIFGTALVDIRPQGISRPPWLMTAKTDQETFDRVKTRTARGTLATFQYYNGSPIIRIQTDFPTPQIIIDPMTQVGNWGVSGTASGLAIDNANYYQAPGSLRFNLTTGAGILSETLQTPISMASYQNVGVGFLAIQIPSGATASDLTSIALALGSDSSNYSTVTATTGFLGSWVSNEWLLVAFDFSGSTDTGTPDWSAIQYVKITVTVGANMTNFHVGGLWICQPSPAQILAQSDAIFLASGSQTPLSTITENTDTIILNDAAYTLFEFECALAVLQQMGGGASDSTRMGILEILNGNGRQIGLYDMYRGDNPSQELRQVDKYY